MHAVRELAGLANSGLKPIGAGVMIARRRWLLVASSATLPAGPAFLPWIQVH
jgi:hypothetical protein